MNTSPSHVYELKEYSTLMAWMTAMILICMSIVNKSVISYLSTELIYICTCITLCPDVDFISNMYGYRYINFVYY